MKFTVYSRLLALTLLASCAIPILSHSDLDLLKEIANKSEKKVAICLAQGANPNVLVPFPDSTKQGTAVHFAIENVIKQITNEQKTFAGRVKNAWSGLKQFATGALLTVVGGVSALAGYDSWKRRTDLQAQAAQKAQSMGQFLHGQQQPAAPTQEEIALGDQDGERVDLITRREQREDELHALRLAEERARIQEVELRNRQRQTQLQQQEQQSQTLMGRIRAQLPSLPPIVGVNADDIVPEVRNTLGRASAGIDELRAEVRTFGQDMNAKIDHAQERIDHEVANPEGLYIQTNRAVRNINDVSDTVNSVMIGTLMLGGAIAAFFGIKKGLQGSYQVLKSPLSFFGRRARIVAYKRIVKKLLDQQNIDLSVRNSDGKTALDLVQEAMAKSFKSPDNYNSLKEVEMWLKLRQQQILAASTAAA